MIARLAALLACAMLALLAANAAGAQSRPAADKAAPAIPASIEIKAAFAALDSSISCSGERREHLYLTVRNEGTADFVVRSATLRAPADLEFCAPPGTAAADEGRAPSVLPVGETVPAGRRAVIALPIGTRDTPRPGTVPLLVEVELVAGADSGERVDRLLASDRVELRIPGLSDVLKLLGVPTLLLLPGILVLIAFLALYSGWDWKQVATPATPTFWVVAISASILLSALYTGVAHLAGYSRDLSERFNLLDVAFVWVASLAIGAALGYQVRRRETRAAAEKAKLEKKEAAGRTFSKDDDPRAILDKIDRLELHWPLGWHEAAGSTGFLIDLGEGANRWLIPQAEARDKPQDMSIADWAALSDAFDRAIGDQKVLAKLVDAVEDPRFEPLLPLAWRGAGKPQRLPDAVVATDAKAGKSFIFRE